MATFYATNPLTSAAWSANSPVYEPHGGTVGVAMGYYNILVNPTAADVIRFCKVPKGAIVFAGFLTGADLDTGTETLDIDIGWEANGTEVADTDGFGNMGVLDGDVVSQIIPVAGIWRPLQNILLNPGYQTFSQETWISGLVNVTAAATGTGYIAVRVLYFVP
jgi:hypothetical protein